jgi:SEC-C motif
VASASPPFVRWDAASASRRSTRVGAGSVRPSAYARFVALVGRNEPCPCGSGRKYKRCCGFDRVTERALEDRLDALEGIARLAYLSPRLLPDSDAFDAWVRAVLAGETRADPDAAISALGLDEPARILAACLELVPDDWERLSARCDDDRDAVGALLGGAVAAGIRDHRPVERIAVETIEESDDLAQDSCNALGLCLDGEDLWSRAEGAAAEAAIEAIPDWVDDDAYEDRWREILAASAARLQTDWHRRRLARLVRRVERQLPFDGFPRANAAVRSGCEAFADDEQVRRRLGAMLLGDLIGRDQLDALRDQFDALRAMLRAA